MIFAMNLSRHWVLRLLLFLSFKMVSFSCQNCNDTVKKPKLQMHMNRCQAPVDCIDCSSTFDAHSAKWVGNEERNAANGVDHIPAALQRNRSTKRICTQSRLR